MAPNFIYFVMYAAQAGCVGFTGTLDNSNVAITVSDIYTHISFGEGLPIALIEAMSLGKPVIASKIGGITEAVIDNEDGLLVENNVESVMNALRKLLLNPKICNELGIHAKIKITKKFDWETSCRYFHKIIQGYEP